MSGLPESRHRRLSQGAIPVMAVIRLTAVMECRRSVWLDVCRSHHLAPLLGFVGDELTEIGGRAHKRRASKVGKPRLDLGIGEAGVDLLVEHNPARTHPRSGCPAGPPSASRSSPRAPAAYQP